MFLHEKNIKIYIILICGAIIASLSLLAMSQTSILISTVAFVVVVAAIFFPKIVIVLLGIYLLFQDYLVIQFDNISVFSVALKRLEEYTILALFILMAVKNFIMKKPWSRSPIDAPLFCLILIAIASSIINHAVPHKIAVLDLYLLLKGFLVFYIFYNLKFTVEEVRRLTKLILFVAVVFFGFGIVDLLIPKIFREIIHNNMYVSHRFGISSVQSFFIHPGVFGWFMAFCSVFCLAYFIVYEKKEYLVFTFLFVMGSIISMRLKSIAGIFLSFLFAFVVVSGSKKIKFIISIGIIILIFTSIFGSGVFNLFDEQIYFYLQSPHLNTNARVVLYYTSLKIANDFFPLGSGLGTFGGWIASLYYSPIYRQYGINTIYGLREGEHFLTDTFWPYIIGEFGIAGFLCFSSVLFLFFSKTTKVFNNSENKFIKAFSLGSVLALSEILFESLGSHVFLGPPQNFYMFAALGIVVSFWASNKDELNGKA